MVPSYWPQLCLELISVHPCGCETQQTFTGCTTTFITLVVLNTTPDCNCTEKPKHTFFQFNSLHSHMTPVSTERFFLLRYLQKMKSTRGAKKKKKKKSFRGCATAMFLEDKGPDLEWDFVDGSPCSEGYWCS